MNKKKLLALLMALVMTLTLVPVTALAEGGEVTVSSNEQFYAAMNASSTTKVTLNADVTIAAGSGSGNGSIERSGDVTLDLNGHTISVYTTFAVTSGTMIVTGNGTITSNMTSGNANAVVLLGSGSMTLENGTITGKTNGIIFNNNSCSGTLTVNGGSISGSTGISIYGAGNVTVNGGTITGTGNSGEGIRNNGTGTVTVNAGATLTGTTSAIWNSNGGEVIVNGGSIQVTDEFGMGSGATVKNTNGTVTIKGGTIRYDTPAPDAYLPDTAGAVVNNPTTANVTTTITGGTFNGKLYNKSGSTLAISGGTFDHNPTTYVVEGYVATAGDNLWTVELATPAVTNVAQIGETKYETLQEALNEGGNVVLLTNVSVNETQTVAAGKTVVLDLAGFDISGAVNGKLINNAGTLTINNSTENVGNVYNTDTTAQGHDAVYNTGTLTINGGHFGDADDDQTNANGVNRGAAVRNYGGTLTVNGGTFTACDNFTNGGYAYAIINDDNGTTTIIDATVYGKNNGNLANNYGIMNVTGGNYTLNNAGSYYGLYVDGEDGKAVTTVSGGTFNHSTNNGLLHTDDSNNAALVITNGKFTYTSLTNKAASDVTITGGVFSTDPGSFVATGYEAVHLTSGENTGMYQVGKVVTTSNTTITAEEISNNSVSYTVNTKIVDSGEQTLQDLGTANAVTVKGTSDGSYAQTETVPATPDGTTAVGDVSLSQLKNADTIGEVIQSAINSAGGEAGNAKTIAVVLVSDGGTTESTNNTVTKITYEVHPEAIVYNSSSAAIGSYVIQNEDLGDTTFTFKLTVPGTLAGVGDKVNVTHKHNGTSENLGTFTVADDHTITLTGVSSFSEFELTGTDENSVTVSALGASLRRRVLTSNQNSVVNTSTDFRMTYQWTLPEGVSLDTTEGACYFLWSKDNGETWKQVSITGVSGNTASIVITGVPKVAFDTTIKSKIHLEYTGTVDGEIEVSGYDRSVTYVATELAKLGNDNMWGAYGNHLLSTSSTYTIDGNGFIFSE